MRSKRCCWRREGELPDGGRFTGKEGEVLEGEESRRRGGGDAGGGGELSEGRGRYWRGG